MTQLTKLLTKLKDRSRIFTYRELHALLLHLGYVEIKKGKTSGSRRAFHNQANNHIIRLHKPHPGDELKTYQRNMIIQELEKHGLL